MENLQKKPAKGILKTSSSFDQQEAQQKAHSDIKWDEMNILQTLHPPGKDYGLMKIEEPKTPYSYYKDGEAVLDNEEGATASKIIDSLCDSINKSPKIMIPDESVEDEDDNDEEELTEEEMKKKREFEIKRKMHYNEYQAVKLARKLLEEEDEEDDENEEKKDEDDGANDEDGEDIEVEEDTGVRETQ